MDKSASTKVVWVNALGQPRETTFTTQRVGEEPTGDLMMRHFDDLRKVEGSIDEAGGQPQ